VLDRGLAFTSLVGSFGYYGLFALDCMGFVAKTLIEYEGTLGLAPLKPLAPEQKNEK
jgi:hypothetical protein